METTLKRLNKYLSEAGYCSRRSADKLIEEGRVTINGIVPEMGTKVTPNDVVKVDGEQIFNNKVKHTYIAFNKPVGIVCTTDTRVEKIISLITLTTLLVFSLLEGLTKIAKD